LFVGKWRGMDWVQRGREKSKKVRERQDRNIHDKIVNGMFVEGADE
jgi:hypothetical protein